MNKASLQQLSIKISSGLTPLRSNEEFWNSPDIPWVKTEQLGQKNIYDSNEKISQKALDNTGLKLYPKNTLSLAMYGEGKTRGSVSILKKEMTTNQACCNIELDENKADYEYVYYYLTTQYNQLRNLSSGVRKNLNSNDIKNFEIRIPKKLVEQQNIASVLSSLDAKLELNNRINAELEAMAKTLYDYWFIQFDFPNEEGKPYRSSGGKMVYNEELKREVPKGWEVKKLGELIKIQRGISYKSSEIKGQGIPMINLNSFNLNGTYKHQGIKEFSGNYTDKHIALPGDLLIASTDVTRNADIIGKAILVPNYYEDDVTYSMDIAKIIPNEELTISYLMMLFNSQHYHDYIKWFASGTLVLHLNMDGVKWYNAEIPPMSLLKIFDSIYTPIANRINETKKQNQQLASLRDWLLPMLMNGQVTIKEAEEKVSELSMVAEAGVEYKTE